MKRDVNFKLPQKSRKTIVEKELGIPPDYQYKALTASNFIQSNWHRNKMFVINKLVNLKKNMTVLDLGTGSGNFEILFANEVKKIVGVDYNDEALTFLNKYLKTHHIRNVDLVLSDIRNLALTKYSKFDLIIMIDVLEHLKFPEVKKVFKNFKKYLKKNGKVIIITPNYKSMWPLIEYAFDVLRLAPKFREHQHLSKLYKNNLEELIKQHHFREDRICTFNLFSYLIPIRSISEKLCLLEISIPISIGNLIAVLFSNISKK